jgi:RNA polymerase sigma-70 factor (ECF subfamily)
MSSMSAPTPNITLLLHAAASGDRRDLDALMTAVYQDMRRLAMSHMDQERANHTLQPTALVHEAYVKLLDQRNTDWKDRLHFFSIASRIIRRILIDHARSSGAAKRGGSITRISVGDQDIGVPARDVDLLALDEAMAELALLDEQQARIVELRYFGGCTIDEIAELLELGKRTVDRQWRAARAWLFDRLRDDHHDPHDGEHPA